MKRVVFLALIIALLLAGCGIELPDDSRIIGEPPDVQHTRFLPIVSNQKAQIVGVEMWRRKPVSMIDTLTDLRPEWVRYNYYQYVEQYNIWQATANGRDTDDFYADIGVFRSLGITPLVVFMGNDTGCKPPSDIEGYVAFIAKTAKELNLDRVEIWNEPDFSGGLRDLYGCHGNVDEFIRLAVAAKSAMPDIMIGASVSGVDAHSFEFGRKIEPYLDWIGVHRYATWVNGTTHPPHNDMIEGAWLTEVNLLNDDCENTGGDLDYLSAQANYIKSQLEAHGSVFVYVLSHQPAWRCSAMLSPDKKPLPVYDYIRSLGH